MEYNEYGTLKVRIYAASEAIPIKDGVVRISGADENNRFIQYSILTDRDGVTDTVNLPSPNRSYSLSPGMPEIPYAIYDIEVSAPGYYTKTIRNVAIFSGINSMQPINMIPISLNGGGSAYPRGNLDATVRENENLER